MRGSSYGKTLWGQEPEASLGWTITVMKNGGDTQQAGQMAQRAWGGVDFRHGIQIADPWTPLSQPAVSASLTCVCLTL